MTIRRLEQDLANLREQLQMLETKGQSAEESQSIYQQKLEKKSKELSEKEAELKSVAEQVLISFLFLLDRKEAELDL